MAPYRYDPYVDPMAGSIGDLIARSAEPQARAAENIAAVRARAAEVSGNAWGNAARQLGQIPQRLEAMQDARLDRSLRQQEQQARTQTLQDNAVQRTEGLRIRVVTASARLAARTEDPEAFIAAIGDPMSGIPADTAAHLSQRVRSAGAAGWKTIQQQLVTLGEQVVKPIDLSEGAKAVSPISGRTIAENPRASKPGEGQHVINGQLVGPDGHPIGDSVPKQVDPTGQALNEARLRELDAKLNGTLPLSPKDKAELQIARDRLRAQVAHWQTGQGDVTDLTPQGLDAAALNYAKTGMLPPLGMGDKNTRKAIINRAAEMMPRLDIASAKADYDANKSALVGLQKQRDAIGAFEQTALKNIDIFLETAGKIVDTGSPLANGLARQISGKLLGSPDQAKYDAARQVAVNEIAKITSNPNLSGQLSDSARHEVDAFNPRDATLKQTVAVARLLKRDMQNRTSAMDDQITGIKARIAKGQATTSTDASDPYEQYLKRTGTTGAH